MERLRNSIERALREAERRNQPVPPRAARPPFAPGQRRPLPLDREGQDAEPTGAGPQETPSSAPPAVSARLPDVRAVLGSRAALRQAFFLREILGPPRALQGPHGDGR